MCQKRYVIPKETYMQQKNLSKETYGVSEYDTHV